MVCKTSGGRLEGFAKLALLRLLASIVAFTLFSITVVAEYNTSWRDLAPPEVGPIWVQPAAQREPAMPIWGHADGLRIGLWPMPGPRGLLRIYTPYLGHREGRMINYIAIEPTPIGEFQRGLSELEMSDLDGEQGKFMWSVDSLEDCSPRKPVEPARGIISDEGEIETLTVFVFVEPFRNGASVYLRLRFRSDRPYEVGISTYTQSGSRDLRHCVVTATMGNYARLRDTYLCHSILTAQQLWPNYKGSDFAPRVRFMLSDLVRSPQGDALFIATPNEANPEDAEYDRNTPACWKYYGDIATQYWRCEEPDPNLVSAVNGRFYYWNSESPIPGGVAIENFELIEPFRQGAEYWFGVTPAKPDSLRNTEVVGEG